MLPTNGNVRSALIAAGAAAALTGIILLLTSIGGSAPSSTTTATPSAGVTDRFDAAQPTFTPSGTETPRPLYLTNPSDPLGDQGIQSDAQPLSDAQALALMKNPTTSETWHLPVEIAMPFDVFVNAHTLEPSDPAYYKYYDVGDHNGNDIVALFVGDLRMIFEVSPGGNVTAVVCPSSNGGEYCLRLFSEYELVDGRVTVDSSLHYDSLTAPSVLTTATGATFWPTESWRGPYRAGQSFDNGRWDWWEDSFTPISVTQVGSVGRFREYEVLQATGIDQLPSMTGLLVSPFGGYTTGNAATIDFDQITWDDGFDPRSLVTIPSPDDESWYEHYLDDTDEWFSRPGYSPGSALCGGWNLGVAVDTKHQATGWVAAGSLSDGTVIYLPNAQNKALPETVRALHARFNGPSEAWDPNVESDSSPPYPYPDLAQFLTDRMLVAYQDDSGRWRVAMHPNALENVYECA